VGVGVGGGGGGGGGKIFIFLSEESQTQRFRWSQLHQAKALGGPIAKIDTRFISPHAGALLVAKRSTKVGTGERGICTRAKKEG